MVFVDGGWVVSLEAEVTVELKLVCAQGAVRADV
jgi:hypothetical protein